MFVNTATKHQGPTRFDNSAGNAGDGHDLIPVWTIHRVGKDAPISTDSATEALAMLTQFLNEPVDKVYNTIVLRRAMMRRKEYESWEDANGKEDSK